MSESNGKSEIGATFGLPREGLMIRNIVRFPNSVLTQSCEPVVEFDDGLQQLATDLAETCEDGNGFGLAAPQIGVNKRVVYLSKVVPEIGPVLLVNPVWTPIPDTGYVKAEEGCLSLPSLSIAVERAISIEVQALNVNREPMVFTCKGLPARVIQHELDHLDGKLIINYLSGVRRSLAITQYNKAVKQMTRRFDRALRNGGISVQAHA